MFETVFGLVVCVLFLAFSYSIFRDFQKKAIHPTKVITLSDVGWLILSAILAMASGGVFGYIIFV